MHLIYEDVNDAFYNMVTMFHLSIPQGDGFVGAGRIRWPLRQETSRNGKVYVVDEPVLLTYKKPRQRVLQCPGRDANPFFHMYEALWMLAGRNDVAGPAMYAGQMKEYSDDGKVLNGAYGYRWRKANHEHHQQVYDGEATRAETWETSIDQLVRLVAHLKAQPNSRRAVLQMWNVEDDLLKIGFTTGAVDGDCDSVSKDVCCNLSVMFSIREVEERQPGSGPFRDFSYKEAPVIGRITISKPVRYLDMTVTNRSNDMIWGLLGANYVHFSFLQEYMACALGVEVGLYHHFTNNLHVYDWNWKPMEWLNGWVHSEPTPIVYSLTSPQGRLLVNREGFDNTVAEFVEWFSKPQTKGKDWGAWTFLEYVAQPAMLAFHAHKASNTTAALVLAEDIRAVDWKAACLDWLTRRFKKQEAK